MSNRRRRDGQPTAEELQHAGSDDGVDDLASILPPGDGPQPTADAVAERQAEAAADSAPVRSGGPGDGHNLSRYDYIKSKFERLNDIKAEQKALREEANEIVQDLEKEKGVNRGALSEVRKLFGLEAAAIQARETSRRELFDLLIKPKLDEATTGEERE